MTSEFFLYLHDIFRAKTNLPSFDTKNEILWLLNPDIRIKSFFDVTVKNYN